MTKITAEVELRTTSFKVANETIKAVNKAADKIAKLMPPRRKHKLSHLDYNYQAIHHAYRFKLGDKDLVLQNTGGCREGHALYQIIDAPIGEYRLPLSNVRFMVNSFPYLSIEHEGSNTDWPTHKTLTSPFVEAIPENKEIRARQWYDAAHLTIDEIRIFVSMVQSGQLVTEVKTAIALAEAKEEAEVKLFNKMKKDREAEERALINALK